ncbi:MULTISPECIES: WXG100 family type VII secretion target [Streptomyces]|uniref:WXG100 family type VII secretion target n=1 Tax=Streptomyces lichenis TaxID=2306967 RepID=A0ABT0IGF4_9ACTN|nr:WXG100 family type VII secretion target [Streptomyces lichenis]MCK8680406.1 WXG100 family type VII secretion target [Streptomyces lichenis]
MAVQKVNGVNLISLQNDITESFDDVKGQLRNLQGVIDSLEGNWRGIGAGAFDVKQTQINNGMVRIGKLMLIFQEAIEATRVIAGNTDDDVERALRGIDVVDGYSGDAAAQARTSNLSSY